MCSARQRAFLAAGVATLAAALAPVTGTQVSALVPRSNTTSGLRHCDYVCSACPYVPNNDDFVFDVVSALDGSNGTSLQSVNFPTRYLAVIAASASSTGAVGIVASPVPSDASWEFGPPLDGTPGATTITSLSLGPRAGQVLSLSRANTAPCGYAAPSGDVVLAAPGAVDAPHQTWSVSLAPPVSVSVSVGVVANPAISRKIMGCHSDYGYVQTPRAFTSNLVYGSSFETGTFAVPSWTTALAGPPGTAASVGATAVLFNDRPTMSVTVPAGAPGDAQAAAVNRGMARAGFYLQAGLPYDVTVYAAAGAAGTTTTLFAELRDGAANASLARVEWTLAAGAAGVFAAYNATLTPTAGTSCPTIGYGSDATVDCGSAATPAHVCVKCGGELHVGVVGVGSAELGFVSLSPGPWGLLAAADGTPLPVLQSGADVLTRMGITVLRSGGTVSQVMRWKDWRGPVPFRPSQQLVWGDSLLSGWGPFEVLQMCEALGIEPVITLAYDLNAAADWADLVECVAGGAGSRVE